LLGCGTYSTDQVDPVFESTAGAEIVVLGDINNDGLLDMASASGESQPIQIHLRNPLLVDFDTYTIAGGAPLSQVNDLELADMNSDGKLDIVLLINDTGFVAPDDASLECSVGILVQGNDPCVAADWSQIPTAGQSPTENLTIPGNDTGATDLAVGDLDGDSEPDIVVLANGPEWQEVIVFPNPGAAYVTDETAWSYSSIELDVNDLTEVGIVDLDNDGDQDVVLSAPTAKSFNLRWLQNPLIDLSSSTANPTPTFVPVEVNPGFEATAGAKATVLGDIDNDGLLDIASISDESQPVQIHLRNATTGIFETSSIAGGAPLAEMIDIGMADFDNNGRLDIAVLVNDTGYSVPTAWSEDKVGVLVLLLQTGTSPSSPTSWTQVNPIPGACIVSEPGPECDMFFGSGSIGATDLDVGDVTGDGLSDIVLINNQRDKSGASTKHVYLYENPGTANVADSDNWQRTEIISSATDFARLAVVDLDEDGDNDVVLTMPDGISFNIMWLQNLGSGASWTARFLAQQEYGGDFIALGDIDGDNHIDVAAASVMDQLTQWFRNPGPTALTPTSPQVPWEVFNVGTVSSGDISQVQLVDLNNDGELDCFVTADDKGYGYQPQSDIEHSWDRYTIFQADPTADVGQVTFADFDGDGKVDIVAPFNREGILNDEFVIYNSIAASLWQRRLIGQQSNGADCIALGDVDGDGFVDVAAASVNLSTAQWFRNPGSAALLATAPQVPWDVFNIGEVGDVEIVTTTASTGTTTSSTTTTTTATSSSTASPTESEPLEGEINQIQLVDLDGDGNLDCFLTATGWALEYYRGSNVEQIWSASPIFRTDPEAEIGRAVFLDLDGNLNADIIAPIDREGLTQDQIVIFQR